VAYLFLRRPTSLFVKRTTWIAAIAGAALGFAAGTAFDVVRAGKTIGVMLYMPFEQSAETAFAAYKTSDPRIAVWMLQHHLGRLDEFAKRGYPDSHRISTERFITHARLAKLYAAEGNSQEEQKQIELATSTGFMHASDKAMVYRIVSQFDAQELP
jgi:hypothetical protein